VFTQTHTHTYTHTHTHTHAAGQPWFPHRHRRDITLKIPRQQQGCLLSPSVMLRATSRSRESLPPADDLRLACALFALLRGKLWEIFTCRWKQWAIFTCRWKQWAISALCGWRCEQTLPCAGKNCQVSSCDTKSMCLSSLYSVCTLAAWGKWFLWLSAMTECHDWVPWLSASWKHGPVKGVLGLAVLQAPAQNKRGNEQMLRNHSLQSRDKQLWYFKRGAPPTLVLGTVKLLFWVHWYSDINNYVTSIQVCCNVCMCYIFMV